MSIFVHFHSLLDYFNVSLILELNSEFRNFKLWDQKLQFKGFVSEILLEYFWNISEGFCDIILKGTVYFYFSILHIFLFFVINKYCK